MGLPQESFMHVGNRESVGLSQTFPFGPKQGISSDFSPSCFVLQLYDRCFSGFLRICLVFCCSPFNLGDATDIFNNCLTISNFSPKCLQSQVLACNVIVAIVKGKARNGLGTKSVDAGSTQRLQQDGPVGRNSWCCGRRARRRAREGWCCPALCSFLPHVCRSSP